MAQGEPLSIPDFALKIKTKYPEYKDIEDTVLVEKILQKYPDYAESVDISGLKKKNLPFLYSLNLALHLPLNNYHYKKTRMTYLVV